MTLRAIDLFAGAGGWSTGAQQAGLKVVAAANHWQTAVSTHQTNHPEAVHFCQDLNLLDPSQFPAHDVVLASPACQGHSRARAENAVRHDASRATAWCVIDTVECTRPKAVLVENVPEFLKWSLFPVWSDALKRLGYNLTVNVLDAADFGVPQNRERVFIVGTRGKPMTVRSPGAKHVGASSFLDFAAGNWSAVNKPGRAQATLDRIAKGRAELGSRFLIAYYGNNKGGRSIDRPIGTLTTRDRYALVDGNRMRILSVAEGKMAMGFPADYVLAGNREAQVMQLGNAVSPPVAREICDQL